MVVDIVCYRRFGHNEGDDPSYTQPRMYAIIESKRSVRKRYTEVLVRRGDITLEEAEQALDDFAAKLQAALDETRQAAPPKVTASRRSLPPTTPHRPMVQTGIGREAPSSSSPRARPLCPRASTSTRSSPGNSSRGPRWSTNDEVDWALGEAIALGSVVLEGTDVRLTGQDTRRGTFSHRHAVLVDHETGAGMGAARSPRRRQNLGRFAVHDSLALGVRRARLRVRVLRRGTGVARLLGGAVRRLRKRRPGDHRQLPGRRRGQVGSALRASSCCFRTATRVRAPSTPRLESSASSPFPPAGT